MRTTYILLLLFLMILFSGSAEKRTSKMVACEINQFSKNDLRETFFEASYKEEAFIRLEKCLLKKSFLDSVDYYGYKGALNVLKARYQGGIFKKLNYVSHGIDLLNTAVDEAPQNIELRFLRFAVAYHLPSLLQKKKELKKDKKYIIDHISQAKQLNLSNKFKQQLFSFMKETSCFAEDELTHFEKEIEIFT